MTLAELRARVRNNLAEPDASGRFSDSELDAYLNEAQFEVADRTEALVKDAIAPVDAGMSAVNLPSDLLGIRRVQWEGSDGSKRLLETTEEYMDTVNSDNAAWISAEGTPERYFTNGPESIRLQPIPDVDGTLRIRYVYAPQNMVADTDQSGLPAFLEPLLPIFATYRALLADKREDAQLWAGIYEARLNQATRLLWKRQSVPEATRILLPVDPRRSVRR